MKCIQLGDVLTVAQLAELNPAFSESTIRWWIYNAKTNGFEKCLIRVRGTAKRRGRLYIDRQALEAWLEEQREAAFPPTAELVSDPK